MKKVLNTMVALIVTVSLMLGCGNVSQEENLSKAEDATDKGEYIPNNSDEDGGNGKNAGKQGTNSTEPTENDSEYDENETASEEVTKDIDTSQTDYENNIDSYEDILNFYKSCLQMPVAEYDLNKVLEEWESLEVDTVEGYHEDPMDHFNEIGRLRKNDIQITYSIIDLNGDGLLELLINSEDGYSNPVIACYAMVQDKVVKIFQGWDNPYSWYSFGENGAVYICDRSTFKNGLTYITKKYLWDGKTLEEEGTLEEIEYYYPEYNSPWIFQEKSIPFAEGLRIHDEYNSDRLTKVRYDIFTNDEVNERKNNSSSLEKKVTEIRFTPNSVVYEGEGAEDDNLLWKQILIEALDDDEDIAWVQSSMHLLTKDGVPVSLPAGFTDEEVFYIEGGVLTCLNKADGKIEWRDYDFGSKCNDTITDAKPLGDMLWITAEDIYGNENFWYYYFDSHEMLSEEESERMGVGRKTDNLEDLKMKIEEAGMFYGCAIYRDISDLPWDVSVKRTVGDGSMLSLVVPATPECTLDVYKQAMNISEQGFPEYERVELLSHFDTGEPILVRANVFDFYSDILVVLTDNYGNEYEYSPYTSLKDGRLITDGYDFSDYK